MEMESQALPGMEQQSNPELVALAKTYRAAVDARMKAMAIELPLKEQLIAKMHEFKIEHYKDADVSIELKHSKETVKVKIDGGDETPDED